MTVHNLLYEAAARFGDRDFIVSFIGNRKKIFSFLELAQMAECIRSYMAESGLRKGDRVLLLWDNGPEYAAIFFGVLMAGGIAVPMNPANYESNVRAIATHCSARFVAATERAVCHVEGWWKGPPVISNFSNSETTININSVLNEALDREPFEMNGNPGELAMVLYTSGTTGSPKGVMLSHRNLMANTRSILSYLPLSESDRTLAILPFYYSYGNSILLTHIFAGATLVVENRFAFVKQVLKTMEEERVTGFSGVPSHFALLINSSNFLMQEWPQIRYLTCAGGGLPPVHIRQIRERLPGTKLYVMYGQTEGTARLSSLDPELVDKKIGSIGKGIPGVDLRVVDTSERDIMPGETGTVIARGENIMQGYLEDPDATAEVLKNGWLYTGDLATVDDEGFIYIKGRSVEFIKSGGYRISPQQVEEVILQHPYVIECAVVGLPDDILGECVTAVVVSKKSEINEDLERSLLAFLADKIPQYMAPRKILMVELIPKTETGKIKRMELRDHVYTLLGDPVFDSRR